MKRIPSFMISFLLLLFISVTSSAESRVALIIGNQNYNGSAGFETLPTCINDAKEIDNVLRGLGFITIVASDANKEEMLKAIDQFASLSKNADVAVYFFSGHATRIGSDLYMVPSRSDFFASSLSDQLVKVANVRNLMERNANLSILFLDACRDGATTDMGITKNQKKATNVGNNNKNASASSPKGCMICYATQDGRTASAGDGTLSPFTKSLVKHLTDGDEFRTVWRNIKNEVAAEVPGQNPSSEESYENMFYFNPSGKQLTAPNTTATTNTNSTSTRQSNDNKKSITINTNAPNATIDFYGSKFSPGKSLMYEVGRTYVYTIEADGYEPLTGKLDVTTSSPNIVDLTLKKIEPATLIVGSNKEASVYLDKKYVGTVYKDKRLSISTTSGKHSVRLSANRCFDYNTDLTLTNGETSKFFTLEKKVPQYWQWDGYDGQQSVRYHYSPKYQIGLSYMYKPEDTRFSFGLYLAASPGWFKGISVVDVSTFVSVGTSTSVSIDDGNGNTTVYKATTNEYAPDKYSSEIDPNNEAKKYNANSLALANVGFNITNGLSVEAGFGVAYHQDRYYMKNVNYVRKTTYTNETTGESFQDPKIELIPQNKSEWFKQDTKWSPALRLGANGLIPLDDWDKYFISFGAGYTFLFTNNKFSSWDANIGIVWKF